jgi:uncharacterized protein
MVDTALYESFEAANLSKRLQWLNEPPAWRLNTVKNCLDVEPKAATDFWQRTHYGFEADNGHFLYLEAAGDFVLTTKVTSYPIHQYDQAGLMVRISPTCWLKTSVEFEPDGPNRLGAVVTNAQYSDWSTQSLSKQVSTIWLRVRAEGADYWVGSSQNGNDWEQIRLARLHDRVKIQSVSCGLYACSPKASGYRAEFAFLDFKPGRLP